MLSLYLNYKTSDNSEKQVRSMSSLVPLPVLCPLFGFIWIKATLLRVQCAKESSGRPIKIQIAGIKIQSILFSMSQVDPQSFFCFCFCFLLTGGIQCIAASSFCFFHDRWPQYFNLWVFVCFTLSLISFIHSYFH